MDQEVASEEVHERFLLVRAGNMSCAVPATDVVKVVRRLRCFAVPGSRPHLVGLAQYGGDPLPVLDLHVLVKSGGSNARHHSTVILGRGRKRGRSVLGLAVDEVLRVVHLPRKALDEPNTDFVGDTVELEGDDIKVLNTQQLLREEMDGKGR
jgi:chemotaxis signal transduction protein